MPIPVDKYSQTFLCEIEENIATLPVTVTFAESITPIAHRFASSKQIAASRKRFERMLSQIENTLAEFYSATVTRL